jgi:hypothetical protein
VQDRRAAKIHLRISGGGRGDDVEAGGESSTFFRYPTDANN